MRRKPKNTEEPNKRLDPMIVVALIGLAGTVIAALLASPLLERWLSPAASDANPAASSSETVPVSPLATGNRVGLNQT